MLKILVKTIVNTNNNTLAKSTDDTNTNSAFEKYCQYQYHYFCVTILFTLHSATFIFTRSSINKVNVVEKMAKSY